MRFLYRAQSELRGRGCEMRAGDGEPGASGAAAEEEKPFREGEAAMRSEEVVAKSMEHPSRKAAIVLCAPVP